MSFFKGYPLAALALAALLTIGPPPAQAADPATDPVQAPAPLQKFAAPAQRPASPPNALAMTGPERRIALVIGNSHYQNVVQLSNPANDARSIAQLLNSAGFEVISATDINHNQMIETIQNFSSKIAGLGPNTVAMVYYAGHGVQLAGENYLVPIDANISSEPDLVNGSVRLVDVMATLEAIPSRMRIVILDACRNNPFPNLNDAGRGLAIVDAPNGSIVGYSTAPGTEALDGNGEHSPYAEAFLRLAREKNLPIEQLFKRIRLGVNSSTDGHQIPWESSSLTSDFYFFGDTAVAAVKAPEHMAMTYAADDLPSRAVRQAYNYVVADNSVENYQEFVRIYPHDPLCDRVRLLLASLLQAQAWHNAVLANSPLAYKSFYERYSETPYGRTALKLASQPKIIPLSQPTHIIAPASLRFSGLGGGNIVTMHPANTISENNGGAKIVNLPNGDLNRMLSSENHKFDNSAHMNERPAQSFSPIHMSERAPTFRREKNMPSTGTDLQMVPTQSRTPAFQAQGFGGGGLGHTR